jgi:hypothetical protein
MTGNEMDPKILLSILFVCCLLNIFNVILLFSSMWMRRKQNKKLIADLEQTLELLEIVKATVDKDKK